MLQPENWRSLNGHKRVDSPSWGMALYQVNMKGEFDVAKAKPNSPGSPEWYKDVESRPQNKPKNGFIPSKFVRSELTDQEKDHLKSQNYVWDDIPEHLVALVEAGYKVSCTNDLKTNSFAVWITPTGEDSPNHGFTLSARGPSLLAALSVAFYKHFTKFDGVWPKDERQGFQDQWG